MKALLDRPGDPAIPVRRSVVVGTAGHIDHGKTALIKALTGTDTDRLPEEKARGITIDLGFAALTLVDSAGRPTDLSIIDVPGHHAFIRNMLAGAGGIECVLLVIAADEGVKAQTVEHLAICSLLEVRHGVIALTKLDAVSEERLAQVRENVSRFAEGTFLQAAPVVAVSAHTGEGLDDLRDALTRVVAGVAGPTLERILRLPLDRAFSIRGFGTVVTGTLHSGSVRLGDRLELQPGSRSPRLRGIQVHSRPVEAAHAPTRVAFNLAGIEVADVSRGDTVVEPDTVSLTTTVDVELTMLPGVTRPRHRWRLGVHAFTSERSSTLLLHEPDLNGLDRPLFARLRLSAPILLLPGDRFVLRQRSPAEIVGGGQVIDAHPVPRLRRQALLDWLRGIHGASPAEKIALRIRRRGVAGISLRVLVQETGLQGAAIQRLMAPFLEKKELVGTSVDGRSMDLLLHRSALKHAVDLVFGELTGSREGYMSRAEMLSRTRLPEWVFDLAVVELLGTKPVRRVGTQLSLNSAARPDDARAELLAKIEDLYRSAGLRSPLVHEAAMTLQIPAKDIAGLITSLVRGGKLVRMGADNLMIHMDALNSIKADLGTRRGETFDVSRFKDFTGLTRKHAIPLLEYLDGVRVTSNVKGIRKVV